MPEQHDFKKEWEKTKQQLVKFGKEAVKIAQQGEKELVKFSQVGKLHIDSTAVSLKREKLYYLIGKEYVQANTPETPTPKLAKLLNTLSKASREQQLLQSKIKNSNKPKRVRTPKVSKSQNN